MAQVLTPADAVVAAFGGVSKTARVLEQQLALGEYPGCEGPVYPSRVSRWKSRDGWIPPKWQPVVLDASHRAGAHLTAEILIRGLAAPGEPA